MGVISVAHIPEHQLQLLIGVLTNIQSDKYHYNLVRNIARSTAPNNDILVVKGVHYQEYDNPTPFHFNIKIRDRGRVGLEEHHVYVVPYAVPTEDEGMVIDPDGTVTLTCNQMMIYMFHSIPTLLR